MRTMRFRVYSYGCLWIVLAAVCLRTASADIVDSSTPCDVFASRTTINGTHDECTCGSDFTGNGTSCVLQARLDCSSNAPLSGFAFKVYLNQSYIDYNNISYTDLHLLNSSCNNVTIEGGYYVLWSPEYDACGSTVKNSSNQIVFSNAVRNTGSGIASGGIFNVEFSCIVSAFLSISLTNNNGSAFQILVNQVGSQSIVLPIQGGAGTVSASMFLYQDANYLTPYNGVPILATDDQIYVKIALDTTLNGVYVISRQCWATPDVAGVSTDRFDIIEWPGCLRSNVVNGVLSRNGVAEDSRFQLQVFTFLPSDTVYIHCQIELCTDDGGTCQPTCPASRRKRDARVIETVLRSSLIIRSQNKVDKPYETPGSTVESGDDKVLSKEILIVILISLLLLFVILILAVIAFFCIVRRRKST